MLIIPAIDILDGQCVRLQQGEYTRKTVYSDNPVQIAQKWEQAGAKYLHIVDLDGAKSGYPKNLETVVKIAQSVSIPVELGGGIRDLATILQVLNQGIQRVVLGTVAYSYAEMVEEAANRYGDRIAVGIDARHGRVMIKGWLVKTDIPAFDLANRIAKSGVKTIIYTDISKDGMLEGPNLRAIKNLACNVKIKLIASGGISSVKDIQNLKELGCPNLIGAIVGKAIYDGQVRLEDAIKIAEQ
ncbi:MAG: 1-(5-phosphoribosyl)-5-[(5-phosphoribosylamino)methylideneamino]imidazole-4-carboxamide isomerase [bacterium]|nr:1-(5-phosphoribosyl)-5-[(5-phosphoribosylamino)methylideneamino]imidazole-4-carboxamide isomerase [bacterium]